MVRLCTVTALIVINIVLSEAGNETATPVLLNRLAAPGSSRYYKSFAGKTYYFGTVFKSSFFRAMQFCRQQGMELASVPTQALNNWIARQIEEIGVYGNYWTSGTNLADREQWIWLSTGENIVYTNWYPGEPNGKGKDGDIENCLEIRHYGEFTWNDRNCHKETYFICESPDDC